MCARLVPREPLVRPDYPETQVSMDCQDPKVSQGTCLQSSWTERDGAASAPQDPEEHPVHLDDQEHLDHQAPQAPEARERSPADQGTQESQDPREHQAPQETQVNRDPQAGQGPPAERDDPDPTDQLVSQARKDHQDSQAQEGTEEPQGTPDPRVRKARPVPQGTPAVQETPGLQVPRARTRTTAPAPGGCSRRALCRKPRSRVPVAFPNRMLLDKTPSLLSLYSFLPHLLITIISNHCKRPTQLWNLMCM
jgi:hypothetical protein